METRIKKTIFISSCGFCLEKIYLIFLNFNISINYSHVFSFKISAICSTSGILSVFNIPVKSNILAPIGAPVDTFLKSVP